MHPSILSNGVGYSLCLFLLLLIPTAHVHADEIAISGDTTILADTEATFYITLERHYPSIFFFGYEFSIDLPTPLNVEVLSNTLAKFSHVFDNVPSKSYTMTVRVFIYFFQQKAWQVAEKSIPIKVTDKLDDFFVINGKQTNLPLYTPKFIFVPNNTASISSDLAVSNSILSSNATILNFSWTVTGPNSTSIHHDGSNFNHNFTTVGQYNLEVDITANLTSYSIVKKGKLSQPVYIKSAISKVNVTGNNFVKNGSLLYLNVSCSGSSNFKICYYFTETISNKSCFESAIVVNDCFLEIRHYFGKNGSQFVNIGVQNDVSDWMSSTKITIYKVPSTRSIVYVILPLASSFVVIIMILGGVTHHIKQRRKIESTIETATMENFGLYGQTSLTEMGFFERIRSSLKDLYRPGRTST